MDEIKAQVVFLVIFLTNDRWCFCYGFYFACLNFHAIFRKGETMLEIVFSKVSSGVG